MTYYVVSNPTFLPQMANISAITNANPAQVTTTTAVTYTDGQIVRLDIPFEFGMQQINGQTGTITVINDTSFTITIDSTHFDVFNSPVGPVQCPQVIPVGEEAWTLEGATLNTLP